MELLVLIIFAGGCDKNSGTAWVRGCDWLHENQLLKGERGHVILLHLLKVVAMLYC